MTFYDDIMRNLPQQSASDYEQQLIASSTGVSGNNTFLAKPADSRPGQLAVLFPANTGVDTLSVIGPDGRVIFDSVGRNKGIDSSENPNGSKGLSNGERPTFFIPPIPPGSRVVGSKGGQQVYAQTILNPSARQENDKITGSGASGGNLGFNVMDNGFGTPGVIPNSINPFGGLGFDPLMAPNIPRVEAPTINPLQSAGLSATFNQAAFSDIVQNSLESIPEISQLLNALNIDSSGQVFNQLVAQTGQANQINQEALTQRVDQQMPGFREATQEDFGVARTLASGGLPDFLDERVLMGGARNSASDASTFGGFGAGSVFGRNVADRLDARTRLGLVQQGQNLTDQIANRAFSTFIDKPAKVNTLVQNPVNASSLFSDFANTLTPLSTISPTANLQSQTQQGQFQAGLDVNRNSALANFGFNANQFNTSQRLAIDIAKAQQDIINEAQRFNALQEFINSSSMADREKEQLTQLLQSQDRRDGESTLASGLKLGGQILSSLNGKDGKGLSGITGDIGLTGENGLFSTLNNGVSDNYFDYSMDAVGDFLGGLF